MTSRFHTFNPQAQQVMARAAAEARRMDQEFVGSEHILLGLLQAPPGPAGAVLAAQGLELDAARAWAAELAAERAIPPDAVGLTPEARTVVTFAVEAARDMGHAALGPEDLLLGLTRAPDGIAARILARQGIALDALRAALLAALTPPPEAALMPPLGDWPIAEFETHGRAVLDLIGDYFRDIEHLPVMATIPPADLGRLLDAPLPEAPEPFETLLTDTRDKIIPNLTHWNHPAFYGYFAISGSMPGILAETLAAAFNVNMMVWQSSPAAAALSRLVLRWIAELVGYPPGADAVFTNGASLGSFYALCAAREALGLQVREQGLTGRDLPRLRLYISDQTHSSLEKAAIALGIGLDNVVKVRTDDRYRMIPEALEAAIRSDRAAGYRPLAVCATVGTTSTASVDPVGPIAAICREQDLWLHIDAAYGGFWGLVPEARAAIGDLSLGDSLIVNPHKTLYTQVEVSCLYCKRPGALAATFSLIPEYLRTPPSADVVNYMDYSLQLGHSFRALKLWWVLRTFGVSGIRARLADAIGLARHLEAVVDADADFQRLSTSPFALVCLRAFPHDLRTAYAEADAAEQAAILAYVQRLNERILTRINTSGTAFISHTVLREGYTLRVSIGNIRTEAHHVEALWTALRTAAAEADLALQAEGVRPRPAP